MDKVIVTALLIIAGVTAAALVVTTLSTVVGKSSRSVVESQKDMSERIQTDVKVIQVHASTATTTKAWVKSIGNSNVNFIELSDLFIASVDGVVFIPLTNGVGVENHWKTSKTGSWTKGETVEFEMTLKASNPLVNGTTYVFSFSTPNGIASEYEFTY